MGTYLSTPVVDKCEETGTDLNGHPGYARSSRPVNWGVVDMQGWRKSMEDAHIARTDVKPPALPPGVAGDAGGSSASGPSKPTSTCSTDKAGDEATTTTSSNSDQPAISAAPPDEPGQIVSADDDAQEPAKVFAVFDGHGGPEVARFCQLYLVDVLTSQKEWTNASLAEQDASPASTDVGSGEPQPSPLGSTAPNIGKALIESFHAMDRMIDDLSRREELTLLRSEKPRPGQYKSVTEGGGKPIPTKDAGTPCLADEAESEEEATDDEAEKTTGVTGDDNGAAEEEQSAEEEEKKDKEDCATTTGTRSADVEEPSADDTSDEKDKETGKDTPALIVEESKDSAEDKEEETPGADASNVSTDADSTASVGGGDSIVNDGLDDDDDDLDSGDDADGMISTADAVALFQKLLTMSGSSGTVELEVEGGEGGEPDESGDNTTKSATATRVSDDGSGTASQPATVTATTIGPNAAQPTRIQNGRQVCNLPDHPIHAGCTSVVAVLVGDTLTVANAGDSRAVLCRAGGVTEALSFDHKPLQDRERNRIAAAGGFVNQFGRVNGNLNLSRSIGDMKYKQVGGIPPSGQMITAEPDVVQVTLTSEDEFLILGCDGIWDCLTNEEAVKYVRDRINDKTPIEIGREMLDEIISDDPRASQGIGGDNMTVMIIDLQPKSRSYFE